MNWLLRYIPERLRAQAWQFIRFCLVGGGGLLITLVITHALVSFFGLWYLYAFFISTLCAWTFIFTVNAFVTFPDHERTGYAGKYVLFLGGYAVLFAVNTSLVYTFTSILGIQYLFSIIGGAFITAILTFFFSKHVIYR